jgi:hypothetical protein
VTTSGRFHGPPTANIVTCAAVKRLYVGQRLSLAETAKRLSCSSWLVTQRLDEMNIPRRPFGSRLAALRTAAANLKQRQSVL